MRHIYVRETLIATIVDPRQPFCVIHSKMQKTSRVGLIVVTSNPCHKVPYYSIFRPEHDVIDDKFLKAWKYLRDN